MNVIIKENGKFEQVYIQDAILYYASGLSKARPKPKSDLNNYSCTLFIDTEARDKLELPVEDGGVFINKQLFEVGVDKNKKRKVKYPTSDQVGEDERTYDDVKGLHGVQLTAPEFKKNGEPAKPKIIDTNQGLWNTDEKPIGNGTKVTVRMWGWRNEEGQLNVTLDTVQVLEYVEGVASQGGFDDVFGVDLNALGQEQPKAQASNGDDGGIDEEVPF